MTNRNKAKTVTITFLCGCIILILCLLASCLYFYRCLYKAYGYTLIDTNGNQVSEHFFDNSFSMSSVNLAVVGVKLPWGTRFGYIDSKGNFKILPVYKTATDFGECGTAIVNDVTYIDQNQHIIITSPFKGADSVDIVNFTEDGLTWIPGEDRKWYLYNIKGKKISEEGYYIDDLFGYQKINVFCRVWEKVSDNGYGGKWIAGYVDNSGNLVIPFEFTNAGNFADNGLAAASVDGGYPNGTFGYINTEGKFVIEPKYTRASNFSEGLASVKDSNQDHTMFIDENGNVCIDLEGIYICEQFTNGYCVLKQFGSYEYNDGHYGAIDKNGNFVIPAIYEKMTDFDENGISCVAIATNEGDEKNELYGYIKADNTYLVEPKFSYAGEFHDGYALVKDADTGLYGYIDLNGEWFLEPQFKDAFDFSNGYACVYLDSKQKVEKLR